MKECTKKAPEDKKPPVPFSLFIQHNLKLCLDRIHTFLKPKLSAVQAEIVGFRISELLSGIEAIILFPFLVCLLDMIDRLFSVILPRLGNAADVAVHTQ